MREWVPFTLLQPFIPYRRIDDPNSRPSKQTGYGTRVAKLKQPRRPFWRSFKRIVLIPLENDTNAGHFIYFSTVVLYTHVRPVEREREREREREKRDRQTYRERERERARTFCRTIHLRLTGDGN